MDASNGTGSATSGFLGDAKATERCRPPCGRIIVPCPEGGKCCKHGWVHSKSMTHECPGSGQVTGSGLVLYGPQAARP